jgi:hypothetical protein
MVMAAALTEQSKDLYATRKDRIVQKTMPGGHIGLFLGACTLKEHWPAITRWIAGQESRRGDSNT